MNSTVFSQIRRGLSLTGQSLRLMVGVGDYEVYVKHMKEHHPEAPVLDYAGWYRNRVDARYGASKDGAIKKCPC
jgi:uncharacterized short protein YbdD (DUF466 family)